MTRHTDSLSVRAALTLLLLVLASTATAQSGPGNEGQTLESPRWTYEIRAGRYLPDLEAFATFYGDDNESYYGLAGSYRFTDWLEVGGDLSQMRAKGIGFLTSSQALGGSVTYELRPVQIYANFIWQRSQRQRVVPYVGVGIAAATYEQNIEAQGSSDGTTDVGHAARLGVRFMVGMRKSETGSSYWRSYLLLEAQRLSIEVDDFELGGDAYLLGFRMEFDL